MQSPQARTLAVTTVLEQCRVSPPADAATAAEFSLPLVFFDLTWWRSPPSRSVLFFDFPISKSHFLDTIVPNLMHSLSLTLNHFLPLAGKIIHPLIPGKPISLYTVGDSVSLTIAESVGDFNHLTGNHPRDSRELYSLVANLPPAIRSSDAIKVPVLALQVTLFPENGVCFGITNHHVIGDASTVLSFIQTWASINKFNGDYSNHCLLPSFDRKNVEEINGLDSFYWDLILKTGGSLVPPQPINPPTDTFRVTFVLKEDDIKKLKTLISSKQPLATHVSSFTVTCALVWVCFAKSNPTLQTEELEYFSFTADCRERLNLNENPPLPATYFGNCVKPVMKAKLDSARLKGRDGILIAAEIIGKTIRETVLYNKDDNGILHDAHTWPSKLAEMAGKRRYVVAGSPRFDFYGVDYGWGRPKKFEVLFVDDGGPRAIISLCRSREGGGRSLEIGISGSNSRIHSFGTAFTEILENLGP